MQCPKCRSEKVNAEIVTETKLGNKHHGIIWWLFIGWWWLPIWWMFFTVPALIVKIFAPKRQQLKQNHRTMCVCQNCGYTWTIKR